MAWQRLASQRLCLLVCCARILHRTPAWCVFVLPGFPIYVISRIWLYVAVSTGARPLPALEKHRLLTLGLACFVTQSIVYFGSRRFASTVPQCMDAQESFASLIDFDHSSFNSNQLFNRIDCPSITGWLPLKAERPTSHLRLNRSNSVLSQRPFPSNPRLPGRLLLCSLAHVPRRKHPRRCRFCRPCPFLAGSV